MSGSAPAGRGGRFWSNVAAVAYKESAVVRHDKAFLSMVLVQPWMMLLLFAFVLQNEPSNVPWALLDRDAGAISRRLAAELEATGYFLPPRVVSSRAEGERLLHRGEVLAFLIVPETLARDVERGRPRAQLLLDGSEPLTAARVAGYVSRVARAFDPGGEPPERGAVRAARGEDLVVLRDRFWFNPTLRDRDFYMAVLAGMLLTNLCLSATSLGLVAERESGTWEQMLAQPTRPIEIVLGKLAPYVVIAYAVMIFSVVVPGLLFGLWPRGSWIALFAVTAPFVLASLAIGVLVSTVARTTAQAVFITVFCILPSFVTSGVMLPYQLMPEGVREIGAIFPLRWYQIATRRVLLRGGDLVDVLVPGLALCAIFAALLALIRWRMKPRLG